MIKRAMISRSSSSKRRVSLRNSETRVLKGQKGKSLSLSMTIPSARRDGYKISWTPFKNGTESVVCLAPQSSRSDTKSKGTSSVTVSSSGDMTYYFWGNKPLYLGTSPQQARGRQGPRRKRASTKEKSNSLKRATWRGGKKHLTK